MKREFSIAAVEFAKRRFTSPIKVNYIGRGAFGEVYKISDGKDTIALKLSKDKALYREADELALLREYGVKAPEILFTDTQSDIYCIGMEYVEGVSADNKILTAFMSKEKKNRLAEQVAEQVRILQSVKGERFGPLQNPDCNDWNDYYRERAEKIITGARNTSNRTVRRWLPVMEELFSQFDRIFSEEVAESVLIHGDFCPANILIDRKTGELRGVIDPLEMRWSDGEYEIFQLFCQTGDRLGLYETYKRKYGLSKNADIKCVFYAIFAEIELYLDTGILLKSVLRGLKKRAARVRQEINGL